MVLFDIFVEFIFFKHLFCMGSAAASARDPSCSGYINAYTTDLTLRYDSTYSKFWLLFHENHCVSAKGFTPVSLPKKKHMLRQTPRCWSSGFVFFISLKASRSKLEFLWCSVGINIRHPTFRVNFLTLQGRTC